LTIVFVYLLTHAAAFWGKLFVHATEEFPNFEPVHFGVTGFSWLPPITSDRPGGRQHRVTGLKINKFCYRFFTLENDIFLFRCISIWQNV
jgi:hypothetical protein